MPNINTKFTLSGEKEYKQAISEIGSGMKVLDSEMRKVSSAYAQNADSVEALNAKNDVLERKISTQTEKIEYLRAALQQSAEKYGEADKRTMQWQASLNNAEAELNNLNNQFDENKQKIADSSKEMGNLGDVVNGLTSKLGIQLPDGMKSSMNAMGSLDAQSLALAGGFAAVAAAIVKVEKAMISMTKESAAFADNIITLSMQTGQSTQQLQEFAYASELIDVSVDTLQGSLTKLTNNMQDTMNGTGNAKASFDKLGVSVINAVDGSMRSANDVFYETIDALGQVKNETERDAMSMDIFGRSAQDLNPLIIQGSKTLKAYADEAHNVGYVLDDEALSALGAVDDAYQRLQKTQEGVKNQLSAEFAPYLEEFYGDVTTMVKDGGKALKDSGIVDSFGMLLDTVGDILNPMSDLSNNRVPALTKALQPLAKVMALIADAAELIKGVVNISTGHIGEGWGQLTHALGFGYSSGNGNNYQNLLDSYTEQQWGQSAADLSKAYEDAIARGDPSTIGITEDEWVRRYLGGNAAGTDNWRGGWTRVNENGLERIFLPSGSRIQTASETRYTSGDTYNTTVYVDHVEDLDTILRIAKNARITARMGAK
uniref:Tail tape measure n=1 Tax=Siphoviridae sp. ctFy320 TaxID=2826217 RepID=A0A8S5LWH7_9CAUD|nr:MAG TPA: tail tape measure [Siphoviridae sp. ctFy320]